MKTIKAWAVVDRRGDVIFDGMGSEIYRRRKSAEESMKSVFGQDDGESVVRVTVRIEE